MVEEGSMSLFTFLLTGVPKMKDQYLQCRLVQRVCLSYALFYFALSWIWIRML